MPELPDVEVLRDYLEETSLHQRIEEVVVRAERLIHGLSPARFAEALRGHRFEQTRRLGKYLFVETHGRQWLVMHFGMTGSLAYVSAGEQEPGYAQVVFEFAGGHRLAYLSRRKLGMLAITESVERFAAEESLGIDAIDPALTPQRFIELARSHRGAVKCWLMDQAVIAGIGNVYSDEILFHAGIHPQTPLTKLDDDRLRKLHGTMRKVLMAAYRRHAEPGRMPEDFLLPHRSEGAPCPRCGGRVQKIPACGRGAYLCPACQHLA